LWSFSSDSNGIGPTEQPSNLKLKIGHVLFIDIVGYSKLLINQQSEQLCSYLRSRQKNRLEKVALSQ
jgi:hypothetical protein